MARRLVHRPADAEPGAGRGHRPASRKSPPCPIRSARHRRMGPAQRPAHRARAHAARRHRRHLREPAQRHRRCRRALPQGRQRRHPARRLGQLPFVPRHPCCCLVAGLEARPACPPQPIQLVPTTDRAWRSASCCAASTARSTSSCRAAARAWSRACSRKRACRSSPISTASATSMSTARPTSPWRARSCVNAKMRRTGVCGAAETLLVDAPCADTHLKPVHRGAADAGCEVRGDARVQRRRPARDARDRKDWSTEYLDAIISVKVGRWRR
jgi:hypothetical protein